MIPRGEANDRRNKLVPLLREVAACTACADPTWVCAEHPRALLLELVRESAAVLPAV